MNFSFTGMLSDSTTNRKSSSPYLLFFFLSLSTLLYIVYLFVCMDYLKQTTTRKRRCCWWRQETRRYSYSFTAYLLLSSWRISFSLHHSVPLSLSRYTYLYINSLVPEIDTLFSLSIFLCMLYLFSRSRSRSLSLFVICISKELCVTYTRNTRKSFCFQKMGKLVIRKRKKESSTIQGSRLSYSPTFIRMLKLEKPSHLDCANRQMNSQHIENGNKWKAQWVLLGAMIFGHIVCIMTITGWLEIFSDPNHINVLKLCEANELESGHGMRMLSLVY